LTLKPLLSKVYKKSATGRCTRT